MIVASGGNVSARGGEGGDLDNPDRLHDRAATRSGSASSPASTGRAATSPGLPHCNAELDCQAAGAAARAGSQRRRRSRVLVNPNDPERTSQIARRARGAHALGRQVSWSPCRRRRARSTPLSRPSCKQRADALLVGADPILYQPARSIRRAGGAPCDSRRSIAIARVRRGRRADELRHQHRPTAIARPASTSAASSRARSRPTCRCSSRPSSSW